MRKTSGHEKPATRVRIDASPRTRVTVEEDGEPSSRKIKIPIFLAREDVTWLRVSFSLRFMITDSIYQKKLEGTKPILCGAILNAAMFLPKRGRGGYGGGLKGRGGGRDH